jgi:hypothetical protein
MNLYLVSPAFILSTERDQLARYAEMLIHHHPLAFIPASGAQGKATSMSRCGLRRFTPHSSGRGGIAVTTPSPDFRSL